MSTSRQTPGTGGPDDVPRPGDADLPGGPRRDAAGGRPDKADKADTADAAHEAPPRRAAHDDETNPDHPDESPENPPGEHGAEAERGAEDGPAANGAEGATDDGRRGRWASLLVPRLTLGHVAVALLCAGLGFAVVTQVRQTQDDVLSGMRQDDLVRLLDELTQRNADLSDEHQQLQQDLAELRSSTTSRQAAQEAAEVQARARGILAGTLPVHGPGVRLTIDDPAGSVRAQVLVTILEELRNADAESVELSGQRLTASSWILDDPDGGVVVDGVRVEPPYEWLAIGDPKTLSVALDIPGGALAAVRNAGGEVAVTEEDDVRITATRELEEPEHATPVPPEGADG